MSALLFFIEFSIIAAVTCLAIAYYLGIFPQQPARLEPRNKAVLVTGCDTGFGHALAAKLDNIGFNVFAGCLDSRGDGARKLQEGASSRLLVVQMDVCKEEDVQAALAIVKQNLPEPNRGRASSQKSLSVKTKTKNKNKNKTVLNVKGYRQ